MSGFVCKVLAEGLAAVHALVRISRKYGYPVIGSLHPRTASKIKQFGISIEADTIRLLPPLGFFDFVHLEEHAFCTLSDSGTVQEETCILGVPNITIRDVTERPETLECGSNLLSGINDSGIERAVDYVTDNRVRWVAHTSQNSPDSQMLSVASLSTSTYYFMQAGRGRVT